MLDKLEDKCVFFDIDGTLSKYRYEDMIYMSRNPELGCQRLDDLLFSDLFEKAGPLKTMQDIIEKLSPNNIFIVGTIVTNNEINQKYSWLKKHYPNIKKDHIFYKFNYDETRGNY